MSILLFFNDTKKLVIHENTEDIFDRGLVNILLEPYQQLEGITYTYDDISTIIVNYFRGDYLTVLDLPRNLKKLEINSTLFEKVVRIIIHHEHKEGLIERLKEELTEAMGMCFTGRMNRLVNSLSGIVEGIKVSFSIEEQIQLESQKIIERLNNKTITLKKAKEEMLEIFNDEDIIKDDSLMRLKNDYVNALDDFADDETTTF